MPKVLLLLLLPLVILTIYQFSISTISEWIPKYNMQCNMHPMNSSSNNVKMPTNSHNLFEFGLFCLLLLDFSQLKSFCFYYICIASNRRLSFSFSYSLKPFDILTIPCGFSMSTISNIVWLDVVVLLFWFAIVIMFAVFAVQWKD